MQPVVNLRDERFYTETFWKLGPAFYDAKRFNLIWGSSNSSKSHSTYQRYIQFLMQEEYRDFMVLRKHGTTLYDSVFTGMKNIVDDFGLRELFRYKESKGDLTISYKPTGRRIVFKGLDDSEKIKSVVNFKFCLLEEGTEFDQKDWQEINRRLRGFDGIKYFIIFNPISRQHWIKKYFFDTPEIAERSNLLHFTFHDNKFATKEDIIELENLKFVDENDYLVYCLGQWGVISDRIVFKNWDIVEEVPSNARPIPSVMDFGFSPDPATLTDLYLLGDHDLYVDERFYERGLINVTVDENDNSIQGRLEAMEFPRERIIIADSSEPKSIRELRSKGWNVFAVRKPGISESIKMLKSYHIHITKRSKNAILEFENYIRKVDRYGVILPEPIDDWNHVIDPIRYGLAMKGKLW